MDKSKLYYVVRPGTNARTGWKDNILILDETGKADKEKLNRVDEEIISIEDYENKFTEPEERRPDLMDDMIGKEVTVYVTKGRPVHFKGIIKDINHLGIRVMTDPTDFFILYTAITYIDFGKEVEDGTA